MKFGSVAVDDAEGAVLAHSVRLAAHRLPKGLRLTKDNLAELRAAGLSEIIVAKIEAGDLDEDSAATRIAKRLQSENVVARAASTGRVNLHATAPGVFVVDAEIVNAINAVDPSITLATLADLSAVAKGQMVATVKIIPFAVAESLVRSIEGMLASRVTLSVKAFTSHRVGLIQTTLPSVRDSVLDKTRRITEARLSRSGSVITRETRVPHATASVAEAIAQSLRQDDMTIVFGASAMCDFDDVVPAAIRQAGGIVIRAGMPVDPGNLLVLGRVGGKTVIGAPGCARSPKENGFDWVLDRIFAGIEVTSAHIAAMGVGGLLMEIAARPQPREIQPGKAVVVGAIVLAAGQSTRMGGPNKLLALFDGTPLVRRVAEAALSSRVQSVAVVTGHQADRVEAALEGLDLTRVANPLYSNGLATSLKAGVSALSPDCGGALVMLGDMPEIRPRDLDTLISRFVAGGGTQIVRATHDGQRGNPVILPRSVFPEIARLEGDTGARHIVENAGIDIVDVEIGTGAGVDVDDAAAMTAAGGVLAD